MPRKGYEWTDEKVKILVEMREQGWRSVEIAQKIGCTFNQLLCKIDAIGTANLPVAYRRRIRWTDEMLETLRSMRAKGHPYLECAAAIGVEQQVIQNKCIELGLNRRMNAGAVRGVDSRGRTKAQEKR